MAGKDIELDAEPEEGKPGEMAEAADRLYEAEKKVKEAEEKKEKVEKEVAAKREELGRVLVNGSVDEMEKQEKEVEMSVKEAEEALRREAKAKAKLEDALKDAEALGLKINNDGDKNQEE